jgi:hypothetical protein
VSRKIGQSNLDVQAVRAAQRESEGPEFDRSQIEGTYFSEELEIRMPLGPEIVGNKTYPESGEASGKQTLPRLS